jgi:hypothetical protein
MWLTYPGPVLIKKHVCASKYDPLVEEVDLTEAKPDYAYVKLADIHGLTLPLVGFETLKSA